MAAAGRILTRCLRVVAAKARPGVTTGELDSAAEKFIRSQGAEPAFKGYRGFPGSICASPNSMVVHGIPGPYALKRGDIVTCTVKEVRDGGIEVTVGAEGATSFIRRSDLSRDRADQRPERFAPGDLVDARVTQIDRAARRVGLSIKALEIAEEKEAVAQYGSADSGASLGDILGEVLNRAQSQADQAEAEAEDQDDAGGDADRRALGELRHLLENLGLGELDLLADEQRHLLADVLDRLSEFGGVVVVRRHG